MLLPDDDAWFEDHNLDDELSSLLPLDHHDDAELAVADESDLKLPDEYLSGADYQHGQKRGHQLPALPDCETCSANSGKKRCGQWRAQVGCRQEIVEPQIVDIPVHLDGTLHDDFLELYSVPHLVPLMQVAGWRAQLSIDLRTGFDLLTTEGRRIVMKQYESRRPRVVMISAPCTVFSPLQNLSQSKRDPTKVEEEWQQGVFLLEFGMMIAGEQARRDAGFNHEHPRRATSWFQPAWTSLANDDRIGTADFDQCAFGLVSKETCLPMQKRTRFGSNMACVLRRFHHQFCDGQHLVHQNIEGCEGGMRRSEWSQHYPAGLCTALVDEFSSYLKSCDLAN